MNYVSDHNVAWVRFRSLDSQGNVDTGTYWGQYQTGDGTPTVVQRMSLETDSALFHWFIERIRKTENYFIKCSHTINERQSYLCPSQLGNGTSIYNLCAVMGSRDRYQKKNKQDKSFLWEIKTTETGEEVNCTIKNVKLGKYLVWDEANGGFGFSADSNSNSAKWNIMSVEGLYLRTGFKKLSDMAGNDGGVFD
ncbi:MAG: hypothetical protein AAF490_03295 [Chloroflexota bacterium]